MNKGRVTVIMDSQAGSCGKGKVAMYEALKGCDTGVKPLVAINNWMSNAGHTSVLDDDTKVVVQHIPSSIANPNATLLIGPGSAITPKLLGEELIKYNDMLNGRMVFIHPRAGVILEKHREEERKQLRSGSTFKGCGAFSAEKVMRQAMLWETYYDGLRKDLYEKKRRPMEDWEIAIVENTEVSMTHVVLNQAIESGIDVIIEGSQGFDLDINYGLGYPHTTSRQCNAGQLVADCGISPRLVTDIYMITRPYPIRISNTTNITDDNGAVLKVSSGDYAGSSEITWDIVKERCNAPTDVQFGEMTTVTKKMRRVFEFNWNRFHEACMVNRPTGIVLNFAQYIDWEIVNTHQITPKIQEFIDKLEKESGVPVVMVGYGARNCEMIDLRK